MGDLPKGTQLHSPEVQTQLVLSGHPPDNTETQISLAQSRVWKCLREVNYMEQALIIGKRAEEAEAQKEVACDENGQP